MNQQLTITIEFTTAHVPDNEAHLKQVAEEYFRTKGILLEDNVIRV